MKYYHNPTPLWRDELIQFFMHFITVIVQSKSGIIITPHWRGSEGHSLTANMSTLTISARFS